MAGDAQKELRAAWDDMLESLARARDAIDQPDLMPPPGSDRHLAEATVRHGDHARGHLPDAPAADQVRVDG